MEAKPMLELRPEAEARHDQYSPSSELYEYRPFNDASSEIRLAYFKPEIVSGPNGDCFPHCSLIHMPHDEAPEYIALSYAWGDPKDTVPMLLDGKRKDITKNLASFLHMLAESSAKHETPFWIDAICIDQANDVEKGQQVRCMEKIYCSAASVYIWLGPPSNDSHLAIQYIECLSQVFDKISERYGDIESTEVVPMHDGILHHICLHLNETLVPFRNLLSGSWVSIPTASFAHNLANWQRLWVLQEVTMPSVSRIRILCGTLSVAWDCAISAVTIIGRLFLHLQTTCQPSNHLSTELIYASLAAMNTIYITMSKFNQRYEDGENQNVLKKSLGQHLMSNRSTIQPMNASLPVDHVYALVAVSSNGVDFARRVALDYSRTDREVFIATAMYLLRHEKCNILETCDCIESDALSLPSWVPNWSTVACRVPLEGLASNHTRPLYAASGEEPIFSFRISGLDMLVEGIDLGKVEAKGIHADLCSPDGLDPLRNLSGSDVFLKWFDSYNVLADKVLNGNTIPLEDSRWRIPVADQERSEGHTRFIRARPEMQDCCIELQKFSAEPSESALRSGTQRYLEAMMSLVTRRMPFLLSDKMLGLGPDTMKPGDALFILLGMRTPVVLRDAGDGKYKIVGDAYVQGLMDGEAMEGNPIVKSLTII